MIKTKQQPRKRTKMKKSILILLLTLSATAFTGQEFTEGFAKGYDEGYKQVRGQLTVSPITPIAPIPQIGQALSMAATTPGSCGEWLGDSNEEKEEICVCPVGAASGPGCGLGMRR